MQSSPQVPDKRCRRSEAFRKAYQAARSCRDGEEDKVRTKLCLNRNLDVLTGTTRIGIGVGTPTRVIDLLESGEVRLFACFEDLQV